MDNPEKRHVYSEWHWRGDAVARASQPLLLWPASWPRSGTSPANRRIAARLIMFLTVWCGLPLQQYALAESSLTETSDNSSTLRRSGARIEADIRAARKASAARPSDEGLVRNLIDQLARSGRKSEAMAEADRFIKQGTATGVLYSQRAFLRRELSDPEGAIRDFAMALSGGDLTEEQRRNAQAGLAEAQTADMQAKLDRAQNALTKGEYVQALDQIRPVLEVNPESEAAMLIRIASLVGIGRKDEALRDADQFIQRDGESSLMLAQRGFLRRELGDPQAASEDFAIALAGKGLNPEQRRNVEMALAEARGAALQDKLERAQAALSKKEYEAASKDAVRALQDDPNSEAAINIRIETLSGMGRKREAVIEADRFLARNPADSTLQARRGYLRRELNDTAGAIEDFKSALAGEGLSDDQRQNVKAALAEARTAAAARTPDDKSAPPRTGRKLTSKADAERLIAQGHAEGWVYAQRGYARFGASDLRGAIHDFDAALDRRDLDRRAASNIRYTRTVAVAKLAESEGRPQEAVATYRDFLETDPTRADGWFNLGYLLLKQGQRRQGADALYNGLELRPVGPAYLDAANAYILTNAPRASAFYRLGLDRWDSRVGGLRGRSEVDRERIKNEVVEADASIRTALGIGGITARPASAGGNNLYLGGETRVRFDGRYLPPVERLEAFARGFSGKDANAIRETATAAGLRYRPIRDLNFYFAGSIEHFFHPTPETEFVLNWGLGLGSDPYPYAAGWKPYWDLGTIGAWRTKDERVLEDVRANAAYLYEFRAPVRGAIGPSLLAVAGYDNKASTPWAGGVGPSLLSYVWLGGDNYRSYDSVLTLQVGYLLNVGSDERQRGWRAQIGLNF